MSTNAVPQVTSEQVADAEGKVAEAGKEMSNAIFGFKTVAGVGMGILLFVLLWSVLFSIGAGYLSYSKYHSILWAIVDTLFAWLYYPFYAFFLNTPTAVETMAPPMVSSLPPPPPPAVMGGRIRGGRR
jgi:hypothetical protein